MGLARQRTAKEPAQALEITVKRRIAGDATFSVDGRTFEVSGRHLAHKVVDVVVDPFTARFLRPTRHFASRQTQPAVPPAERRLKIRPPKPAFSG